MQADLANKNADSALETEQLRWEPWKVMATAVGASAALFGASGALPGCLLPHAR